MMSESIHSIFQEFHNLEKPEPFWKERSKTIIYGVGNTGKDVFRILKDNGIYVSSFLDQKAKPDSYWNSVPIFQYDDKRISIEELKQVNVVIALHNRDAEIPPIIERLKLNGYKRIVTLIELYDYFGKELGDRYWLTDRSYYLSFENEIKDCYSLWADEKSREIYTAILHFRFTGDYSALPKPDVKYQYFPRDIPPWPTPLRLVDCGAFDGDTLKNLTEAGIKIESVVAFEPDEENFRKLVNFCKTNKMVENAAFWPCGVWSSIAQLRFTSGQGEANQLSLTGNAIVQCVSLDEAIPFFKPTLIKMDIEGAEYDALLGTKEIIAKYRPGLAISLYHRPEHLWEIPLLIKQLTGEREYKYYLRTHAFNGFELVLYGIPE